MKIVVTGRRNKVDFLIGSLLEKEHEVTVVNDKEAYCRYLPEEYNIPVIVGNPCKRYVPEEAETDHADILITLHPGDPDNLVICQTARRIFHVEQAVITVSNPRNVSIFKKLGVNTTISATYTVAKIIEQVSTIENLVNSLSIEQGNIVLSELLLTRKCAVVNKKLKEPFLPKNVIICCTLHNVDTIVPNRGTVLQERDKLLLLCPIVLQECVFDMLTAQELVS